MILSLQNQAFLFFVTIIIGFIIGLIYDFFRLLRKIFSHTNLATYIEDALFWLISTFITFYILLHKNNLEFRLYLIIGIAVGAVLYFSLISYYVITITIKVIKFFIKPINFIIKIVSPFFTKMDKAKNKAIYKEKIILQKALKYGKIKGKQAKTNLTIIKNKI